MTSGNYIEKYKPKNCIEVTLDLHKTDGILGIPVPHTESVVVDHAEVRVVLFHRTHQTYLSNFLILPAKP